MKLAWAARSAKRRDSKPAVMSHGPVSSRPRKAKPVTEQELGEAVAGAHEITAQVLAAAQQVTEAFLGDGRHVDEAQLAGGEQARQALGVSTVGLDSVGRRFGNQTRRGDPKIDPALRRG